MEVLNDLFYTNKKVLIKTIKTVLKSQELFVIGIPYLILPMIVFSMAGAFGFLAGMIIIACLSAIVSDFLYVIEYILIYEKFSWDAFKIGYKAYFRNIFGTIFIIYLVNYAIDLFVAPIINFLPFGFLMLIALKLLLIIIFNSLPEVFYQKKYDELDSLSYSFAFIKKNPINWFVPNILMAFVMFSIYKFINSLLLGKLLYSGVGIAIYIIVMAFFMQVFVGFALVYRGYLFRILDTTSRRKRLFKRHM